MPEPLTPDPDELLQKLRAADNELGMSVYDDDPKRTEMAAYRLSYLFRMLDAHMVKGYALPVEWVKHQ